MAWRMAVLVTVLALCSCRGGDRDESAGKETPPGPESAQAPPPAPAAPPSAGRLAWGPVPLSSSDHSADGISAALGVGQSAIVWIEEKDPGADVFFARIAGEGAEGSILVTRGASAYPPTAVEWTGKEFALAWGDDRYRHVEIFVARVSWNGKLALKPRRFTQTVSDGDESMGVFSADSSQNPAIAYYGGQLLTVWGGPGEAGRQQVYYTTVSKAGKPNFDPVSLTSGITDAVGMRLRSYEKGALLAYCVHGAAGNELYRLHLSGSPPDPAQSVRVSTSSYIPCSVDHAIAGDGSIVFWAQRDEDEGGALEDSLWGQLVAADGTFVGEGFELPGVRLVKFPGKHHSPFDVLELEVGRIGVAWVQREHDGSATLRIGVFDAAGHPHKATFSVPTQAEPQDPHLVPGGQPGSWVLAWLDRPLGSKLMRVYVAGLVFD